MHHFPYTMLCWSVSENPVKNILKLVKTMWKSSKAQLLGWSAEKNMLQLHVWKTLNFC